VTPTEYLGIPVALIGAFLLAFGSQVQQEGVAAVEGTGGSSAGGGLGLRQLLGLIRNRRWLAGTVMVVLAIACQLTALGLAPIAVVQPVGVFALVITAVISARVSHQRLDAPSVRSIAICVAAVVIFVTVAALTTRVRPIRNDNVIVVLIIAAAVVLLLGAGFVVFRKRFSRIFYVIASGVLFGFVATLAKVIIGRVETVVSDHQSPFAVGGLTYLCLLGIVLAGSLGQYFQQSAFRAGSPEVVVAGLTVVDPIVGATLGLAALGEGSGAPGWSFAVFAVAGLVSIYGVVQLSRRRPTASP
jgi:drug/metabolite transporter (DMT)-like permease